MQTTTVFAQSAGRWVDVVDRIGLAKDIELFNSAEKGLHMKFKILSDSLELLESRVQTALNNGWELHGELKVLVLPKGVSDPGGDHVWTTGEDELWGFQAITNLDDNADTKYL